MMNHKIRKSWVSIVTLLLAIVLLPFSAFAVTEDTLEAAPETVVITQVSEEAEYLPVPGTPWNRQIVSPDETTDGQFTENGFSRPYLTDLELARTRRLLEEKAAGKVTYEGDSVVNVTGSAFRGVGVYPLNPEDYKGESFYVLLPQDRPLSDTQILALAAAFDELGIAFDPDSLGGQNCCRNVYQAQTRYMADEETARYETIRTLVRSGAVTAEDIPAGTPDFCLPVNQGGVPYYDSFALYPYRSMTDDELTLLALHKENRWEDDQQAVERVAAEAVQGFYIYSDVPEVWNTELIDMFNPAEGSFRILYDVSLEKDDPEAGKTTNFYVNVMKDTGYELEIGSVEVDVSYGNARDVNEPDKTPEECAAAAKEWAEANLQVPGGKLPETWEVEYWPELTEEDIAYYGQYGFNVTVSGETPEWVVYVTLFRNTLEVSRAGMTSKKWYPMETDSAPVTYLPSGARPTDRKQVSADEKTDSQMVIRHTDYRDESDGFYLPWLTDLELARTRRLAEQFAAGEVTYTGPSAVNASGDMDGRVGVYPLNPEDYDGETFYVLLPQYETLTDEQILSLIAAFDELGIEFDPDSLNARNCSRNRWFRQTRALTQSEEAKLKAVKGWVREGLRTEKDAAPGTPNYYVEMDWEGDNASFFLYPYRELTYDEMTVLALNEYPEGKWEDDPAEVEKIAADAAAGLLRKLSKMEVWDEERYEAPRDRDGVVSYIVYLDNQYASQLSYQDWDVMVIEKKDPGASPEIARIQIDYPQSYPATRDFVVVRYTPDRTDEELIEAAKAWAEENLQMPDGQEPEWSVTQRNESDANPNASTACVQAATKDWSVSILLNEMEMQVWTVQLDYAKWYPGY